MSAMKEIQANEGTAPAAPQGAWRTLFEDRYGSGSAERLLTMLAQPCVTFARIASEFGVTRECVRRWHQRLLPDAPRGHRRQQLCREHHMKRRLLEDALFLRFYRHVRSSVQQPRVTLIPARHGFRKRAVRIDGRTIALKRARRHKVSTSSGSGAIYTLANAPAGADLLYYELSAQDYLLLPRESLLVGSMTYVDTDASTYRQFKNTLAALRDAP